MAGNQQGLAKDRLTLAARDRAFLAAIAVSPLLALEPEQFIVVGRFQLVDNLPQLLVLLDNPGDFQLPGGALGPKRL